MTLDITTVTTALGDYFRKNRQTLMGSMYYDMESYKYMTKIPGVKDELVGIGVVIDELHQAFQCDFVPKTNAEFTPVINKVHPWMIDVEFKCWETLEQTYLGWLLEEKQLAAGKPQDTTLGRFLWDQIIQKAKEERELYAGTAQRVAPTTGVPGAVTAAWDGFLTVLADLITAGAGVNIIPTGAIVPVGAFTQVEGFMRSLPPKYRNISDKVLTSYAISENVDVDFRNQFPYQVASGDRVTASRFTGTNATLQPLISMGTSGRLLFTPKSNFLHMFDFIDGPDTSTYQVIQDIGKVKIRIQGKLGFGFDNPREVFCNDQP